VSYIRVSSSSRRLATGWTIRGSNPERGEIFRTRPARPWGPPSLLYNGYQVSFPGVKRPGRGVDHPPPSRAEVKERVELYLYSPSGPSWSVLGRTLHYFITITQSVLRQVYILVQSLFSREGDLVLPLSSSNIFSFP
jgi:hypothetical protein